MGARILSGVILSGEMVCLIASGLALTQRGAWLELSASVVPERFPRHVERLWWRFPPEYVEYLHLSGDPLIPALLLPAMARGERLVIEAPVSPRLLAALPAIQALYRGWLKTLTEVEVIAPPAKARETTGQGVGCFFSGGVDSFHSLLKRQGSPGEDGRITHLLFIAGFDIKLKRKDLLARLRSHLQQVAAATGQKYLEIGTNLKYFGDRRVDWFYYFGAVLASVGLALESLLGELIIPSSYDHKHVIPCGSHPLLDPAWSTERTSFVHDGLETSRAERTMRISGSDLALEHLHVCWRNRHVFYNCGECEKCLRTMIPLYAATGRTEFPSFSRPLRVENVAALDLSRGSARLFAEENLSTLAAGDGFSRELHAALSRAIERSSPKANKKGTS